MKRFGFFIMMYLLASFGAGSVGVEIDGINYEINTEERTATVIKKEPKYEEEVVIPSSIMVEGVEYAVTDIGENAFWGCTGLTSVIIPSTITSIGNSSFYYCTGLTSVSIPSSVTSIGDDAFGDCTGLTSVTLPTSITRIEDCTFINCKALTSLTIPSSVTSIGSSAFMDCKSLTSIEIPSSVTSIEGGAFFRCTSLSIVELPSSVSTIGEGVFYDCKSLISIEIPSSLTNIPYNTFHGCTSLSTVTIPSSVTSIENAAFSNCTELADVYCYAETVPMTEGAVFEGTSIENATLHVPASAVDKYKATEPWSKFGTIEAIQPYHPFVEAGKLWRVHGFNMGSSHTVTDYYFSNEDEAETIDGHTYLKMYAKTGEETTLVGLFREINQKVYKYDPEQEKEYLVYDFSLKLFDDFHLESEDLHFVVTRVSEIEVNGEKLKTLHLATKRADDSMVELDWIEGIGNQSTPIVGFDTNINYSSWNYYVAYALYDNTQDNNYYLPLTFGVNWNGWWGQQPQTVRQPSFEGGSKFEYELLPDPAHDCYQLHVYGDTVWSNSPNRYAYCVVEKSSSVYKVSIKYEELEPCIDGIGRYHVDLYFPFFLAEHHYVTVDNYGEHPVVVRQDIPTDYRPFIEEGKVWKVGTFGTYSPEIGGYTDAHSIEYFYFDGDTIVGGQRCKKMMCREECDINWHSYHEPQTSYVGAIYENNQRVYCALPNSDDFVLLYDFASAPETEIEYYNTLEKESTKGLIARRMVCEDGLYHGKVTEINLFNKTYIDLPETNIYWREGVGYNGFYNSWYTSFIGSRKNLMQCTLGDEILYNDPSLKDCVTPQDSEVKKNWLDFTHTVKTRPKGPRRVEAESDEETVTGEYSVKELFVNFKTLTGPYTITVLDAAGQPIYNKVVQTSNVVALNTDISTYPKGSYTITVENEEEAYSAEFKTGDEDGLSPTPPPVRQGSIYNLKGQRLTQPQHGVNIVNGRKVVVK